MTGGFMLIVGDILTDRAASISRDPEKEGVQEAQELGVSLQIQT
jgi:hypothetical protein